MFPSLREFAYCPLLFSKQIPTKYYSARNNILKMDMRMDLKE
jgi:hypothetical protein